MSGQVKGAEKLFSKPRYDLPDLGDITLSNWSWETVLFPLLAVRLRGVLWVFVAVSVLMTGYFGFKDAGSYTSSYDGTSYEAGSIFKPESYYFDSNDADLTGTGIFGPTQSQGEAAEDEVNRGVGQLRAKNMPGMLLGLGLLGCTAIVAFAGAWGMMRMQASIKPLMNDMAYRKVFIEEYEVGHLAYVGTPLDGLMEAPIGLFSYVIERCLQRGSMAALHERGIPARLVQAVRDQARYSTAARVYLFLDGISDAQDLDDPTRYDDAGDGLKGGASAGEPRADGAAGTEGPRAAEGPKRAEAVQMMGTPQVAKVPHAGETRRVAGSARAVAVPAAVQKASGAAVAQAAAVPAAAPQAEPQAESSASVAPQPPAPAPAPAPRVVRFCSECGARLVEGTTYCPICGTHVKTGDGR